MGQLRLAPTSNVRSLRVSGVWKGEVDDKEGTKASPRGLGSIEPPLPLTPERLELIKTYAENSRRNAESSPASKIAQRFAPRARTAPPHGDPRPTDSLTTPSAALASGIRRLTAVLVAVALLPNLTLAAFWLDLIDPPWSQPVTLAPAVSPALSVAPAIVPPVLSTPDTLEARRGEDVTFPIALDGTDGVSPGSVIVIRGLPQGSTLSSGRPRSKTVWSLKPDEIGDLRLVLPNAWSGESNITIQLLAPNSGILADAAMALKITPDATASIAADATEAKLTEAQVTPDQEPEAMDVEERAATADPATLTSDLPPLPTRRPEPPSDDDAGGVDWIRPAAYVNLRESPSSSASVVRVVPKGAKLRVTGRKRAWVQVTDPATTQSGWIYSGALNGQ